jgi:uncharacterized membrane protein YfcA
MPLIAAAAVAAGAALQSATGFGFSLIAAPLVFATVEPEQAVGLMTLLGTVVNVLTLAGERRRPRPELRESAWIVAAALPGAVLGVAVLRALDAVALQIAVTVGVFATVAARRLAAGRHLPRWGAPVAGFVAGGLTTSTTTSGPPLIVYLLGRDLTPAQLRDTMPVCFLGLSLVGVAALAATGTSGAVPDGVLVAILVPVVVAGHVAGRPVFGALARSGSYERVVTAILLVSVIAGLATAVL